MEHAVDASMGLFLSYRKFLRNSYMIKTNDRTVAERMNVAEATRRRQF